MIDPRFIPQKFEEIFTKWDREGKEALSFWDTWNMTQDLRLVMDPFGW
jgi:peroxygenase